MKANSRLRTAYHEAGHAIVAKFTEGSDPVEQVSIISRGMTGGVTVYLPEKDRTFLYKKQLLAWLRTGVAGRAAEHTNSIELTTNAKPTIPNTEAKDNSAITNF